MNIYGNATVTVTETNLFAGEWGIELKQIGMRNKQSARMGVVELMLHVPAQTNSIYRKKQ